MKMVNQIYTCGYSNVNPGFSLDELDNESKVFSFEDDFPTADEIRNRKQELNTTDVAVLGEIKRLLNEACDCTSITYEGDLSLAVKKFLCEKGYKISTYRQYNTFYTIISWRK